MIFNNPNSLKVQHPHLFATQDNLLTVSSYKLKLEKNIKFINVMLVDSRDVEAVAE